MNRVLGGRYEIMDKLGEGGMAVTYRAHDPVLNRMVAIKVMREHLGSDPQFQERFRREAQAAANLTHENVAAVHDSGVDGDCHYIVMELVEGEDLKRRLRRVGMLPIPQALDVAAQVARALEAAHARGIVHRDIKPHNILITSDGKVKVTDFGIAKAATSSGQTETGTIMGSVHYFSPEQARGEATGPQADIYSLGVVLFEMLTGRLPFEGENPVAVAHKQIYDPPPLPSHFNHEIPPELDALVLRCLAKDLTRRYSGATELLSYLAGIQRRLEDEPTLHVARRPPVPPIEQTIVEPPGMPNIERPRLQISEPELQPVRSASRTAFGLVFLAILLAGALLGATMWMLQRPGGAKTNTITPDLCQLDVTSAKAVLRGRNLKFRLVGKVYSDFVPRGLVVRQEPEADARIRPGSGVDVWLSLGPKLALVPDVSRMSAARAGEQLKAAGFKAGNIKEQADPVVPVGFVVATDPAAGARAERGSTVNLVVSTGPPAPAAPENPEPTLPEQEGNTTGPHTATFRYTVPGTGTNPVEVRVEVEDDSGKTVLYKASQVPGTSIPDQTITYSGRATVKVYLDGQQTEARVYGG